MPGIGRVRTERILAAWREQKAVREIMVFLHEHGVGTGRAVRIYRTYGANAVQVMSQDPYRLIRDIRSIGFLTADGIAKKLGIEPNAMIRIRAGLTHVLQEATSEGHCGLPEQDLVPQASRLLEVADDLVRGALDLEIADGNLVPEEVGGGSPACFSPDCIGPNSASPADCWRSPKARPRGPTSMPTGRCRGYADGSELNWPRARRMRCAARSPRR